MREKRKAARLDSIRAERRFADQLLARVDVADARLLKCSAAHCLRKTGKFTITIQIQSHASIQSKDNEKNVVIRTEFSVIARPEADESESFTAEASFLMVYKLQDRFDPSDDQVKAFSKWHGVHDAWPYMREFVESTMARMAIPGIRVPLYHPDDMPLIDEEPVS